VTLWQIILPTTNIELHRRATDRLRRLAVEATVTCTEMKFFRSSLCLAVVSLGRIRASLDEGCVKAGE
jgi:hypothetical protein